MKPPTSFLRLDTRILAFMQEWGILLLRVALGIVFIWFGVLKVAGISPAAELAHAVTPQLDSSIFLPVLGVWEIIMGLGFLFRKILRVTIFLFIAHMFGTFLVFFRRPDLAFQGNNIFALTLVGEFVMKNLVLLAAGLVVGSTVRSRSKNT